MSLKLQLSHLTPLRLIGWLIGSIESLVWHQVLTLRGKSSVRSHTLIQHVNMLTQHANTKHKHIKAVGMVMVSVGNIRSGV